MPLCRARTILTLALGALLAGPVLPLTGLVATAQADQSELSPTPAPAQKSGPRQSSIPAQNSAPSQNSATGQKQAPAAKPAAVPTSAQLKSAPPKPGPAAKPAAAKPPTSKPPTSKPIVIPPPAAEKIPADPQQAVAELVSRAVAAINDKDLSPLRRRERLRALIDRHFDLPAMAQVVLGRHWTQATETERRLFVAAVDDYMVATYAPRIAGYGGLKFTVRGQSVAPALRGASATAGAPDTLLIRTAADQPDAAPPIPIDWRAVRHGDVYKITDVIISGVSLVQMKRAEVNSVVYWSDGQMTALLDRAAVLVSCAKE